MNRDTAPTDWKGAAMQKRIAGRYAAERRFKLFGLGAVLLSGFFLAFLLFVMVGNGVRGFTYTHVAVPVDFQAMPLLGLNGLMFIGHGRSNAKAIRNALIFAERAVKHGLLDRIRAEISE